MDLSIKEQINFFIKFKDWYREIIQNFKFDEQKDYEARDYLSKILKLKEDSWNLENILHSFKDQIQSKLKILIYGCGPSLEETIEGIIKDIGYDAFKNCINLAADGAAVLLNERGIPIHAIFTDLDGITNNEFSSSKFMIIHAHGNNIENLKEFKKNILNFNNIIGTTQVEPLENLVNPGGFTDGDRILYFLRTFLLPHHKLFLIGMDFNNIIGKYSKPEMKENQKGTPTKLKKLKYAVKLLDWLSNEIKNDIIFINSESPLKKKYSITLKEFEKIIID